MNVLFIWDGSELSDYRRECVLQAQRIYPEAHFVCILKGDWPFDGFERIEWDGIKSKISDRYGVGIHATIPFSDYARFIYLSENKYTLYIDTDIYCIKRMEATPKTGYWKTDICALWSGGNSAVFHRAVKNRKSNNVLAHCAVMLPENSIDLKPYCIHKHKF